MLKIKTLIGTCLIVSSALPTELESVFGDKGSEVSVDTEVSPLSEITDQSLVTPSDVDLALAPVRALGDDWDQDGGLQPSIEAIRDAREFLKLLGNRPLPRVNAVADGTITLSKVLGTNLLDVEIDGSGKASVFFGEDPYSPILMEVMEITASSAKKIRSYIS